MQLESLSWFPGHMTKTRRMIEAELSHVDAVCEIVDARIPMSSRNPDFDDLINQKPRMLILNRADQADPNATLLWKKHYESLGFLVMETDAKSGKGVRSFSSSVQELLKDKIKNYQEKGQAGRILRLMVIGVPNVGKSTLINKIAGRTVAKSEDRPGVTRSKQWVPIDKSLELMDTPGVLWPKFDQIDVGIRLAFTGAVKDDVIDMEDLACRLLAFLSENYPESIEARYKDNVHPEEESYELLQRCGRKRGFLISGGEVDTERMARILLDEYRNGTLGRFTLEMPPEVCS